VDDQRYWPKQRTVVFLTILQLSASIILCLASYDSSHYGHIDYQSDALFFTAHIAHPVYLAAHTIETASVIRQADAGLWTLGDLAGIALTCVILLVALLVYIATCFAVSICALRIVRGDFVHEATCLILTYMFGLGINFVLTFWLGIAQL